MCQDLQPEFQITSFFSLRSIFVRCICYTEKPCWTKLSDKKSRTLHSGGVGTCKVTPTRIRELLGATRLVGCRAQQEISNLGISRKSVLFFLAREMIFYFSTLSQKTRLKKEILVLVSKHKIVRKNFPFHFRSNFSMNEENSGK